MTSKPSSYADISLFELSLSHYISRRRCEESRYSQFIFNLACIRLFCSVCLWSKERNPTNCDEATELIKNLAFLLNSPFMRFLHTNARRRRLDTPVWWVLLQRAMRDEVRGQRCIWWNLWTALVRQQMLTPAAATHSPLSGWCWHNHSLIRLAYVGGKKKSGALKLIDI